MYQGREHVARMYQTLVDKGFETVEWIIELREWFLPLWPLLSLLWASVFVTLFYLYVSPNVSPPTDTFGGTDIGLDKVCHMVAHAGLLALPLAIVPNKRLAWVIAWLAIEPRRVCRRPFRLSHAAITGRSSVA